MKKLTLLGVVLAITLCSCNTALQQTSIDTHLDSLASQLLTNELTSLKSDSGLVMIVSTTTGEVKAMGGKFGDREAQEDDFHKGETSALESVATWLAAIETGKVSATDTVDTGNGVLDINHRLLRDHNWRTGGYGTLTYHDAFLRHSNIATYKAAETAFADRSVKTLADAFNKVGLKVVASSHEMPTEFAWTSIGYSAITTAWDYVTFFNAIANNGKLLELTTSTDHAATPTVQIASDKSIQAVRAILEDREGFVLKELPAELTTGVIGMTTEIVSATEASTYKGKVELIGYYPATGPQYTIYICVYADGDVISPAQLAPLYEGLLHQLQALDSDKR